MNDAPTQPPGTKARLGRPPSMDDPRRRILREAASLFARKGFEGTSLADLAAAMGLSKPAIYNYFISKQAVYDAIILETLTLLAEQTRAAIDPQAPAQDQLRAFMSAHARCIEANFDAFVATLVGFSGMNQAYRAEAVALRDAHEGALRAIVDKGVREGGFRAVEPEIISRAVLSMLSWMARWFIPGGGKSAETVALEYADLILTGLLWPSPAEG